jgi:ATP-binding cassette subfamily B protein/subfamily B ATP-binding cassette protein MsbA
MRNFIRVLRFSWAYKSKLIVSAIAAGFVALFWSLNLSAVYPVLQILSTDKNLHTWVDEQIAMYEKRAEDPERNAQIEVLHGRLKAIAERPDSPDKDNVARRAYRDLAKLKGEQEDASNKVYRYRALKTSVINAMPTNRFQTFVWIVVALVLGTALKGLFEYIQEANVGVVVQRTLFDFRNMFFRRAIHQDLRQLGEASTTELMSRVTNDVEQLGNGMKMLYGRALLEPLKMLGCVGLACLISWQLTVLFALVVLVTVVALNRITRSIKKAARRVLERMSILYKVLRESFDGLKLVKGFSREAHERKRFRAVSHDYYKRTMRVIKIDAAVGPLLEALGVAAVSVSLLAGAYLVLEQQTHIFGVRMIEEPMGFEALVTLYMSLATIADPVRKLSSVYTKMQSGMAAADRIFALYDRVPSIAANAEGPLVPAHSDIIEFRNVCFSYFPGQSTLLDVNLEVKAGETIALVGPNGCGKSTLLGLLPRFYDADHGSIFIDGVPIREANLRSLRKQIGLVTQDTVLFDDTIYNNIAYGKPGATAEEIEAASKKAHAHDFITAMPLGYQAPVGDMGASKLSGGQKQRISLARAILRDPRILILDEFTSQIDGDSEAKIHEALKEFVIGRTTFLITHRLSTLELADRIVVMDTGRIVAIGTHAELIASCLTYRRLYDGQILSATDLADRHAA